MSHLCGRLIRVYVPFVCMCVVLSVCMSRPRYVSSVCMSRPNCVYIFSVPYVYCHTRVYVPSVSVSIEALKAAARYALELAIQSVGAKRNVNPRAEKM